MYEIKKKTLEDAYKPYDVVTDENGNVGFIQEVNVNNCQTEAKYQISYAVNWLVGDEDKHAWFHHEELTKHCNIFMEIAKCSTHPMGHKSKWVPELFKNII